LLLLWYSRTVFQPNIKIYSGITRWHSLGALAEHGVCADDALELYIDCCTPLAQRQAMFDRLDDIHLQALSDSRDLILRIDLCMNWGVSAVLLPKLHCSNFMGGIIPLMMRLLLMQQMIEVCNVNFGGYSPGGRRSISARSERVQSKVNSANNVADSNTGVNGNDSNGSNSNNKDNDSFNSKGGDFGEPNNGNSDNSEDGVNSQHSNASDMAIYAKDSRMDN
jgi:hypothetical protein